MTRCSGELTEDIKRLICFILFYSPDYMLWRFCGKGNRRNEKRLSNILSNNDHLVAFIATVSWVCVVRPCVTIEA